MALCRGLSQPGLSPTTSFIPTLSKALGAPRAPGGHGWHSEMSRILVAIHDWGKGRLAHSVSWIMRHHPGAGSRVLNIDVHRCF